MLDQLAQIHPDQWTKPFWDATARHELVCQKCSHCGTIRIPPTPFCWNCRSQQCEYPALDGTGVIFTYSTTYFTASKQSVSEDEIPYTVVVVELDGAQGCRLTGLLVPTTEPVDLEIGKPVRVSWEDFPDGTTLPRFALI